MALRTPALERLTMSPTRQDQAIGSLRLDWLMIVAALWWIAGIYIDSWAHEHGKVDQSFLRRGTACSTPASQSAPRWCSARFVGGVIADLLSSSDRAVRVGYWLR